MTSPRDPVRRTVVTPLAGLPFISLTAQTSEGGDVQRTGSRTLVAYFSRSKNTRVVAGLSAHDLSGMTLPPFVSHGGYWLGNRPFILARHAPKAQLRPGFLMQADQERQTIEQVNGWLKQRKQRKE